jgi:hypothetical protein
MIKRTCLLTFSIIAASSFADIQGEGFVAPQVDSSSSVKNPAQGEIVFDWTSTTAGDLKVYDGDGWVTLNPTVTDKIATAKIVCKDSGSGGSSITTDADNMIATVGNRSGNDCLVTLETGFFSATPTCWATNGGVEFRHYYVTETNATSVTLGVGLPDGSAAANASAARITCKGAP